MLRRSAYDQTCGGQRDGCGVGDSPLPGNGNRDTAYASPGGGRVRRDRGQPAGSLLRRTGRDTVVPGERCLDEHVVLLQLR